MPSRMEKVQDLLHKEIAKVVIKDLNNPTLSSLVTISSVKVSRDLRHSVVYFTSLNDNQLAIEDELNRASGYIRGILAKKIHLKRLPSLKFIYDNSEREGLRIDSLLQRLSQDD